MVDEKITCYAISFINSCKRNNFNIPNELYRHIFSFVEDDFKNIINNNFLINFLEKKVIYNFSNEIDYFSIHIGMFPYSKNIDFTFIKNKVYSYFRGKILRYKYSCTYSSSYTCSEIKNLLYTLNTVNKI